MKKKVLVAGLVLFFLLAGGVFAFWRIKSSSTQEALVTPLIEDVDNGSSLGERDRADNYLVWNDPGGFAFSYPESWLFDKHEQDVTNYANLTITKRGETGGIKILATDSKYKTILDWTKKDTNLTGGSFMETTLGGVRAQKALVKTGAIVVGMIDSGVIYTVELEADGSEYWKDEYNKLLTSFKLVYPTNYPKASGSGTTDVSSDTGGDVIEEAEEVIE